MDLVRLGLDRDSERLGARTLLIGDVIGSLIGAVIAVFLLLTLVS